MSLEDGEYELDISVLLQNASTIDTPTSTSKDTSENIAIRYGFIPDSMDQSKPLKLYQKDQTCILKALSTEGSNKPIFFEGIPQRYHRNSSNNSSSTPNINGGNNDSFYLTFNKELNGNVVHLKKLESTIRFNKSRNVVKVQKQVNDMEKEYDRRRSTLKNSRLKTNNNNTNTNTNNDNKDSSLHLPNTNKSSRSTPPIRSTPTTSPLRKPPTAKKTTTKSNTKTQPQRQQQASKTVSSKRPPISSISTPDLKPEQASEPIISESDFEDLEMDDATTTTNDKQHDFPVIEFDFDDIDNDDDKEQDKSLKEESKPKSQSKPKTTKKPTKPKTTKPKKQTKIKKPIENPDKSMELDDEFKDLEDQLQEVLEEEDIVPADEDEDEIVAVTPQESSHTTDMSTIKNLSPAIEVSLSLGNRDDSIIDSDESEFEDFHFTGIKIDEGNNDNGTTKKPAFNLNTTGKPRSLRDLVGGGNTPSFADGSSSEEE